MNFDYTDAWHPTVNPSARMPIHHLRHAEILGHHHGILNEFPRLRGGTTIRLPRIRNGVVHVIDLPGQLTFAPWWLSATETAAAKLIENIFTLALNHTQPTDAERDAIARLRAAYTARCTDAHSTGLTIGEALWQATDQIHRTLTPGLPALDLVSLTRSPDRHTLADALAHVPGGLSPALARWARSENAALWPLLAVATSREHSALRVRLHAGDGRLDIEPLPIRGATTGGRPQPLSEDGLITMLREGRLIPGSRLTALAEAVLHQRGARVRHFGNTYGHLSTAGELIDSQDTAQIACCADDADSWHYADLPYQDGGTYPLHLLELASCTPDAHDAAARLIHASHQRGTTIHLETNGDLDASLRRGRAGLLR